VSARRRSRFVLGVGVLIDAAALVAIAAASFSSSNSVSGGPYSSLGTVNGAGTTTFTDTTPAFSTAY
jgi:hypothetical protein